MNLGHVERLLNNNFFWTNALNLIGTITSPRSDAYKADVVTERG